MSSIIEAVVEFLAELLSDWVTARWPWVEDVVGATCLAAGLALGLSSSGTEYAQALLICGFVGIGFGLLLLVRAWRLRRAAVRQ
ncbi:hypothetical protein SAMN03159423_4850 [Bradyrhizobium sp. NFR13]|uniref:hypothetical protein n=1 Tax=Bradyrhizobium sp. NFR13 TaxID=1566285 RepID=UPI0008E8FA23|nr:hypothetical protein [Bradyrhizobium sp. NFR13]SFM00376.1 hypothetical protein SAMN03159423_4850 [Bradyrhizobium sp. NFR13]